MLGQKTLTYKFYELPKQLEFYHAFPTMSTEIITKCEFILNNFIY